MPTIEERYKALCAKIEKKKKIDDAKKAVETARKALQAAKGEKKKK